MQETMPQFKTEELEVRNTLKKLGYTDDYIESQMSAILNSDPDFKALRNEVIREVSKLLKGIKSGLRPWLVYDLLSKVTGLSTSYIREISNSINPTKKLKNGTKN
jgi:hypothetical protein